MHRYTMTLQEYISQVNPVRMPDVILQKGEYKYGVESGTLNWRQVFIDHDLLGSIEYAVLKNHGKSLWTTDADGNPVRRSCFRIK